MHVSIIERILLKKYNEEYHRSGQIKEVAAEAAASYVSKCDLLVVYNYDPLEHLNNGNRNNAIKSKGCGCKLCIARHEYVKSKMELSNFRKAYYYDKGNMFDILYKRSNFRGTMSEFYVSTENRLSAMIEIKKLRYKSIAETIEEALTR